MMSVAVAVATGGGIVNYAILQIIDDHQDSFERMQSSKKRLE